MKETTMQSQMRRILGSIHQISQTLQAIVWGFQKGEKDIFLKQVIDFADNFVRTPGIDDERTAEQRIEQAEEVVNAIKSASKIFPIDEALISIFDTIPGGEVQKSDKEKIDELLTLIKSGVDAIKQ